MYFVSVVGYYLILKSSLVGRSIAIVRSFVCSFCLFCFLPFIVFSVVLLCLFSPPHCRCRLTSSTSIRCRRRSFQLLFCFHLVTVDGLVCWFLSERFCFVLLFDSIRNPSVIRVYEVHGGGEFSSQVDVLCFIFKVRYISEKRRCSSLIVTCRCT